MNVMLLSDNWKVREGLRPLVLVHPNSLKTLARNLPISPQLPIYKIHLLRAVWGHLIKNSFGWSFSHVSVITEFKSCICMAHAYHIKGRQRKPHPPNRLYITDNTCIRHATVFSVLARTKYLWALADIRTVANPLRQFTSRTQTRAKGSGPKERVEEGVL